MPLKFDAVAYLSRPIAGRSRLSTRDQEMQAVYAETPEAAARAWLWRLGEAERGVINRIIVWPPEPHPVVETYKGPTIVYRRESGKLVEAERRPG